MRPRRAATSGSWNPASSTSTWCPCCSKDPRGTRRFMGTESNGLRSAVCTTLSSQLSCLPVLPSPLDVPGDVHISRPMDTNWVKQVPLRASSRADWYKMRLICASLLTFTDARVESLRLCTTHKVERAFGGERVYALAELCQLSKPEEQRREPAVHLVRCLPGRGYRAMRPRVDARGIRSDCIRTRRPRPGVNASWRAELDRHVVGRDASPRRG